MTCFVEKLLGSCGETNQRELNCPGTKDIFTVDKNLKLLSKKERKLGHTNEANMLFLTKRRLDILTAKVKLRRFRIFQKDSTENATCCFCC